MSISEKALYHGAALYEITQSNEFKSINRSSIPKLNHLSVYQLNQDTGLYIKYNTSDYSPWRFTFTPEHQDEVRRLFDTFVKRTFIICVCGTAGFCIMDFSIFASCIDLNHKETEWIEVSRPEGGSFKVRGKNGQYNKTIPLNAFPKVLFE